VKGEFQAAAGMGTLLCIGAHADDLEIGIGGTVLQLVARQAVKRIEWVVLSATGERKDEARRSAARFLQGCPESRLFVERFRDGFFPFDGAALKEYMEALKQQVDPDVVFTHRRDDRHQDHRTVSDLTWNSFRDHTILEYEIPKYDGDLGRPNLYVPLSDSDRRTKVDYLMESFASQRTRVWFTRETFDALMRLRGMECNAPSGYAEAVHAHKLVWTIGGEHGA